MVRLRSSRSTDKKPSDLDLEMMSMQTRSKAARNNGTTMVLKVKKISPVKNRKTETTTAIAKQIAAKTKVKKAKTTIRSKMDSDDSEATYPEPCLKPTFWSNQLILSTVFDYLEDLDDIKNCRLVHSLWNTEASLILKKNSVVCFNDSMTCDNYKVDYFAKKLTLYVEQMKNFHQQNFSVLFGCEEAKQNKPPQPRSLKGNPNQELHKLFEIAGKDMKTLKLNFAFKLQSDFITLENITKHMTNLTTLTLQITDCTNKYQEKFWNNFSPQPLTSVKTLKFSMEAQSNNDSYRPRMRIIMQKLVALLPNVETLHIIAFSPIPDYFLEEYLSYHEKTKEYKIKDITAQFSYNRRVCCCCRPPPGNDPLSVVKLLSEWPTGLRRCQILPSLPQLTDGTVLQTLINRHADTLVEMEMYITTHTTAVGIRMPVFPLLKVLKITFNHRYLYYEAKGLNISFDFYPSINYKRHFPMLKELSVTSTQPLDYEQKIALKPTSLFESFFPESDQICSTLRYLHFPLLMKDHWKIKSRFDPVDTPFLFTIIERMVKMFPNVRNKPKKINQMLQEYYEMTELAEEKKQAKLEEQKKIILPQRLRSHKFT